MVTTVYVDMVLKLCVYLTCHVIQAILSAMLKDEDNKYCVDCDAKVYIPIKFSTLLPRGLYIGKYHPPGGGISANVIWGKKYEKAKRKRRKM